MTSDADERPTDETAPEAPVADAAEPALRRRRAGRRRRPRTRR